MTAHLVLIAIGPVQDFISQARRTRDLWYGSHLLSELSRTVARELAGRGAKLIFPALDAGDVELQRCEGFTRSDGQPPLNIANKILAELPGGTSPEETVRTVREKVLQDWRDRAEKVKQKCEKLLAKGVDQAWNEQVNTFLEFTAAWLPLNDHNDYARIREKLEEAVASRKLLRDFEPWKNLRGAVPRSSLDGARETVLAEPGARDRGLVRKYRIPESEQLDAIGLIKRAGGEPEQFVPVVNVAVACWLDVARSTADRELKELVQACKALDSLPRVNRQGIEWVKTFPFEASVLFPNRWKTLFKELEIDNEDPESWGKTYVRPLTKQLGEPYPYVACLVADGDSMGRALSTLTTPDAHRAFSRGIASFANRAREIVEGSYRGILVYSGGDDVLAFLPLPTVLHCAKALREAFDKAIRTMQLPSADAKPTLSVGVGIGHVLESMGDLLELGREAERYAKGRGLDDRSGKDEKNALAVLVDKRSGGKVVWRASWNDDPVGKISSAMECLRDRLSSRKVYEIAKILDRLPEPPLSDCSPAEWAMALKMEVLRALSRVEGGGVRPEQVGLDLEVGSDSYEQLRKRVREWVSMMSIARVFDEADVYSGGGKVSRVSQSVETAT